MGGWRDPSVVQGRRALSAPQDRGVLPFPSPARDLGQGSVGWAQPQLGHWEGAREPEKGLSNAGLCPAAWLRLEIVPRRKPGSCLIQKLAHKGCSSSLPFLFQPRVGAALKCEKFVVFLPSL